MGILNSIGLMFDILHYAMDSMFWGVLLAIAGVALLFYLIRSFYPKYTFTPLSFVAGAVIFVLVAFQSVFICGAFKIKGMTDEMYASINSYIPQSWVACDHAFTTDETQQICDNLRDEYPLFACYVGTADFRGHTPATVAQSMVDEIHSFMNRYILRRVAWCLGFIIVGTFIVVKTMEVYRVSMRRGGAAARRSRRNNDF
ncbi:MAG: hypothetical protein IJ511_03320 [Bacteroides sp.]|nr:hypothetical protein [Bacteroides sp.]